MRTPGSAQTTGTERAVLGVDSAGQVLDLFDAYSRDRLGQGVAAVVFRAGRIDAVWGLALADGREVVVKAHRPPVDVAAVAAAVEAQQVLGQAGFPCPTPLSGPDRFDGHVLTAETTMTAGAPPDGRVPGVRALMAAGLAEHLDLLRAHPHLIEPAGAGPSWCRYQGGPWPTPHDSIVDFTTTPEGYAWLDDLAGQASEQVLAHRGGHPVVLAHADWYAGNLVVDGGRLVGSFDWELVADAEAVVAGITAASYASSSTSGGGLSTPGEATGFLQDHETARGAPFDGDQQRAAVGAAGWIIAFNARWEVSLRAGQGEGPATALARQHGQDYLHLTW